MSGEIATLPVLDRSPVLNKTSPLARGVTFSIREAPGGLRLLVWRNGDPVVDEIQPDPVSVVKRLAGLLAAGTLGAFASEFIRDLTGR